MSCLARRVVSIDDDGDISEAVVDYEAVVTPMTWTREERALALTESKRTRRRHRAWMELIDKGLLTYKEIADDMGYTVQAIYQGVARARVRQKKIKAAGSRHGV